MKKTAQSFLQHFDLPVLVICLVITFIVWQWSLITIQDNRQAILQHGISRTTTIIQDTFQNTEQTLHTMKGFFDSSDFVSRDEFETFVNNLDLPNTQPELVAISFVSAVKTEDIKKFEKEVRAEGFSTFTVQSVVAEQPVQYLVNYVVNYASTNPTGKNAPTGQNLLLESTRKEMIEHALKTHDVAVSDMVTINNVEKEFARGFIVSIPVYKENDHIGFINALISEKKFLNKISRELDDKIKRVSLLPLEIPSSFASYSAQQQHSVFKELIHFPFQNRVFDFQFEVDTSTISSQPANLILLIGIAISFLIYAMVYALSSSNERAVSIATTITAHLETYKKAIENSFDQIVITDPEGIVLYANSALKNFTGYDPQEVIGKTPRLWGRQMSHDFYVNMWNTIKNEKKPFKGELKNLRKDGTQYDVLATISPILNDASQLMGFVAIEQDISQQKKFERSLQEEKEHIEQEVSVRTQQLSQEKAKLSASLSSIPLGLLISDIQDHIVISNEYVKNLLGLHRIEHLAQVTQLFLEHSTSIQETIEKCKSTLQRQELKNVSFGEKYFHILLAPITLQENQSYYGIVITIEDVTEVKILERSKDEFFSIASHELRTPLTAIRGNTSMMLDHFAEQLKDPQLNEMVSDVHDSSIRLIGIVNDFLNTSRLEQGRMEYSISTFDLSEIIADVVKELTETATQKNIKLVTQTPAKLQAKGDKNKVKEVLINLVGNAIKYSERGLVTVTASVEEDHARVDVADSGRGIPLENQSLLFHKFQQAGNSLFTRDTTKGTGLGLYISKLMIEGMKGTIRLDHSELEKGSVFTFTLPTA